ncbi:MAG: glycosyltransferase family 2 protein [Chloroflexi bacterium]|nr:glycosyltransferase family 2 protein [Chloroflexota bacterium]
MNLAVVIPALNEAECLPRLIAAIPRLPGDEVDVIVVDNGSTDTTAETARKSGARVVTEPRRGYGFACAAGFGAIDGAEVVVFLDGDYSFDPAEMPGLLAPLREGRADMVLGSRLLREKRASMLPHQHFGNWLTAQIMRQLYGLRLTDLGPYRAVRADLLASLDMREMTFGWPTEMIVKAARRRARIVEMPVSHHPRLAGKSKVSGTLRGSLLASYFILRTTFRYAVRSAPKPLRENDAR